MTTQSLSKGAWVLVCGLALAITGFVRAEDNAKRLDIGGLDRAGGTIKGMVKFKGVQKKRRPIPMAADPYCAKYHAKKPGLTENYVFGKNDTLQNVFVEVTKGLEGKDFPVPKEIHVIDQQGCMYSPHVSGCLAGQKVEIYNNDNTLHNVKCMARKNPGFNKGMPVKGMKLDLVFQNPEVLRIQCDVHAWMNAYLHVVKNPFFAVTQDDGTFEIRGLPPGEYEISFWHEMRVFQPDHKTLTVKVGEGETKEVTVTYAPRRRKK